MTWQFLLAAQRADAVISYSIQQLTGDEVPPMVNPDECSDEFKVLTSQLRHLSITEEDKSEVPKGLLFFKRARIVAPASIWQKLFKDVHGTGHVGITKTYNSVQALFWWLALFSDVKRMVDCCQTCLMSRKVNPHELVYHPLEVVH